MYLASKMARKYFDENGDRIKAWIKQRHDFNPYEKITFEEFTQEFPADNGWDDPTLDLFIEEYLSNILEAHEIRQVCQAMESMFDDLLDEYMQGIEEEEEIRSEFDREYREAI